MEIVTTNFKNYIFNDSAKTYNYVSDCDVSVHDWIINRGGKLYVKIAASFVEVTESIYDRHIIHYRDDDYQIIVYNSQYIYAVDKDQREYIKIIKQEQINENVESITKFFAGTYLINDAFVNGAVIQFQNDKRQPVLKEQPMNDNMLDNDTVIMANRIVWHGQACNKCRLLQQEVLPCPKDGQIEPELRSPVQPTFSNCDSKYCAFKVQITYPSLVLTYQNHKNYICCNIVDKNGYQHDLVITKLPIHRFKYKKVYSKDPNEIYNTFEIDCLLEKNIVLTTNTMINIETKPKLLGVFKNTSFLYIYQRNRTHTYNRIYRTKLNVSPLTIVCASIAYDHHEIRLRISLINGRIISYHINTVTEEQKCQIIDMNMHLLRINNKHKFAALCPLAKTQLLFALLAFKRTHQIKLPRPIIEIILEMSLQ